MKNNEMVRHCCVNRLCSLKKQSGPVCTGVPLSDSYFNEWLFDSKQLQSDSVVNAIINRNDKYIAPSFVENKKLKKY